MDRESRAIALLTAENAKDAKKKSAKNPSMNEIDACRFDFAYGRE